MLCERRLVVTGCESAGFIAQGLGFKSPIPMVNTVAWALSLGFFCVAMRTSGIAGAQNNGPLWGQDIGSGFQLLMTLKAQ